MAVLDVNPDSASYTKVVGRLDLPNVGDELHHFGWNACSAALCPTMPHPHVERRYLLVPGLRSSRMYIVDTQPDPKNPKIVKTIEPDELMQKSGYSRPHTIHCGPDAIYVSALGAPDGNGPGGIFLMDHRLRHQRAVGEGPRAAAPGVRLLVAPRARRDDHQRVGHAEHGGERRQPGAAAGRQVRPPAPRLGPAQAQPRPGARPRRRAADGAGAAALARPEQGVRLRRRGHQPGGSLGLDLALAPRQRRRGRSRR